MCLLLLVRCVRRYAATIHPFLSEDTYSSQAERDPEEEGDFMAFEQLMAEAAAKKESKHDKHHKDKKKEKEKEKA